MSWVGLAVNSGCSEGFPHICYKPITWQQPFVLVVEKHSFLASSFGNVQQHNCYGAAFVVRFTNDDIYSLPKRICLWCFDVHFQKCGVWYRIHGCVYEVEVFSQVVSWFLCHRNLPWSQETKIADTAGCSQHDELCFLLIASHTPLSLSRISCMMGSLVCLPGDHFACSLSFLWTPAPALAFPQFWDCENSMISVNVLWLIGRIL